MELAMPSAYWKLHTCTVRRACPMGPFTKDLGLLIRLEKPYCMLVI